MYICVCHGVTEEQVVAIVDGTADAFIFASIVQRLKSKNSCCKCLPRTREVIDEAIKEKAIKPLSRAK